jgi:hypothetical protein
MRAAAALIGLSGFSFSLLGGGRTRLRLRRWIDDDFEPLAAMCADRRVMEFFPSILSREETEAMWTRIHEHIERYGFGPWVMEVDAVFCCNPLTGGPSERRSSGNSEARPQTGSTNEPCRSAGDRCASNVPPRIELPIKWV